MCPSRGPERPGKTWIEEQAEQANEQSAGRTDGDWQGLTGTGGEARWREPPREAAKAPQ
jgi:hypothetical protein